jgi:hypothetical protein
MPKDGGLQLFFHCAASSRNKEIGLVEMNKKMELSPYTTLLELSNSNWNVLGIENSAILLSEGDANRDKKLTFYRIPIR